MAVNEEIRYTFSRQISIRSVGKLLKTTDLISCKLYNQHETIEFVFVFLFYLFYLISKCYIIIIFC